jgi:hypothetical protein
MSVADGMSGLQQTICPIFRFFPTGDRDAAGVTDDAVSGGIGG